MRCPNCEAEIPDTERFCPHCGVPIEGAAKCPHCGAALLPGEQFCGECGREVNPPSAPDLAAPPVPVPAEGKKERPAWLWVGIAVGGLAALACIAACVIIALGAATPTPTPTPSPTPLPTSTPTPSVRLGALLYEEDFATPSDKWTISDEDDAEYSYDQQAYSINVRQENWMAWDGVGGDFADFVLDFDAVLVDGDPYNAYGVLFRYQDKVNHYELDINGNGSYAFGKDVDDEWTQLVEWTSSPAIRPLGQENHVRLIAHGPTFTLYVNDQLVAQIDDTSLVSGDIAPVVTAYDTPPGRATFDNIKVWAISAP